MIIYVLTHEYPDRSAFSVCGATKVRQVAEAWYNSSDETNIYPLDDEHSAVRWMEGIKGWRQLERQKEKENSIGIAR
jgi:hypothetical protein